MVGTTLVNPTQEDTAQQDRKPHPNKPGNHPHKRKAK